MKVISLSLVVAHIVPMWAPPGFSLIHGRPILIKEFYLLFFYMIYLVNITGFVFATYFYFFIDKMIFWATYLGPIKIQTKKP